MYRDSFSRVSRSRPLTLGSFALAFVVGGLVTGCPQRPETKVVPAAGLAGTPVATGKVGASAMGTHGALPGTATAGAKAAPAAASRPANPNFPTIIPGGGNVPKPSGVSQKPSAQLTGVIVETMDAAGYTYLKFKQPSGDETWAAVMQTKVAVGDSVTIAESMTMQDFHSKTLDRTFSKILFASVVNHTAK